MTRTARYQIEVAPCLVLPLSRPPSFTYISLTALEIGKSVRIPFGRQSVRGVVLACRPLTTAPPAWMKHITAEIPNPTLTTGQIALAEWLSLTYFTPLGNCLKHFLFTPVATNRTPAHASTPIPPRTERSAPALSKKEMAWAQKAVRRILRESKHILLVPARPYVALRVLELFVHDFLARQTAGTLLILVPNLVALHTWAAVLDTLLPREAWEKYHSGLAKSVASRAHTGVRSGNLRIILGTRQALFLPFTKLGHIIVLDEENSLGYKQWDMSPRYHARAVVAWLSHFFKAPLTWFTPTPSLELFVLAAERRLIPLPSPAPKKASTLPTIINMRLEKKVRGGRLLLSETLQAALSEALRRSERIVLIGKQRGLATFSICQKCRAVLRCPTCAKALVSDTSGHYRCLSCGYQSPLFPRCSNCGELTFLSFGAGLQALEREVERRFPKTNILRLDADTLARIGLARKSFALLEQAHSDIVIATPAILSAARLPGVGLIAIMESDSFLVFPAFDGEERLAALTQRARYLLSESSSGIVLLQTFHPEARFFRDFHADTSRLRDTLISERQEWGYPPFGTFLTIECHGRSPAHSKAIGTKLISDLKHLLPAPRTGKSPFRLEMSQSPRTRNQRSSVHCFLGVPRHTLLPPAVARLLRATRNITIDVEPLSLT